MERAQTLRRALGAAESWGVYEARRDVEQVVVDVLSFFVDHFILWQPNMPIPGVHYMISIVVDDVCHEGQDPLMYTTTAICV